MDSHDIARDWAHLRAGAKEQWAKLTASHLDAIGGNRERLIGTIRQVYGLSQEQAEKQVSAWLKRVPRPALLQPR
jgi:uncharacterized protein YjbJ (UPF0337 family)